MVRAVTAMPSLLTTMNDPIDGRPQADLSVLRIAQAHADRSDDILARLPGVLSPTAT